jgi:hypothetical protein
MRPLRHQPRVKLALAAIAGLTALTLSAASSRSESSGRAMTAAAHAAVSDPFPEACGEVHQPPTPSNPPPPEEGIGAPGPGSPDAGAVLSQPHPGFDCFIQPHENEKPCFKIDGATHFWVENRSGGWAFDIVEKLASDGTVLRTRRVGGPDLPSSAAMSFMPNTTLTLVSRSPWPRPEPKLIRFTDGRASHDFLCEVRVHDPYSPGDWGNHTKCTWTGAIPYLALFTNYGDRSVFVNEWYGNSRHGSTEVRRGEPKVLPLHTHGSFWVGAGGLAGPPIKLAVTDYRQAHQVPEMWVRDQADIQGVAKKVAINLSPYPVCLRWFGQRPDTVTLPPNGRARMPNIGPIFGSKAYGTGEVARVLFLDQDSGSATTYTVTVPPPNPDDPGIWPHDSIAWLGNPWRSVRVRNIGTQRVALLPWIVEPFVPFGGISLKPGETGILSLFDYAKNLPATSITGMIEESPVRVGNYTDVRATEWVPCRSYFDCDALFNPVLNSLTGSVTGLEAGQVHLSMQGRLTLARSGVSLPRARVELVSLLDEAGAAGELVDAAASGRVHLVPSSSRGRTTVFFETRPPSAQPIFRLEITRARAGFSISP